MRIWLRRLRKSQESEPARICDVRWMLVIRNKSVIQPFFPAFTNHSFTNYSIPSLWTEGCSMGLRNHSLLDQMDYDNSIINKNG